ncbi:hypothetical protein HD806DRAFT_474346 [Xylariaceae sp. AK1471]|nr:hypothetical protein HD806DRAFT_474346 [Xylariaceae sp. AK1471]
MTPQTKILSIAFASNTFVRFTLTNVSYVVLGHYCGGWLSGILLQGLLELPSPRS